MNRYIRSILAAILVPLLVSAQSQSHYTMFMYNKLLYNPGYAGSREATSVNGIYRNQWVGISGAPTTISITADGPVGSYMKPFRSVATGISLENEHTGVETTTSAMAYYAYRIPFGKTVFSGGLRGGARFYSANYSKLSPYQLNDPNLISNLHNAVLPNVGVGAYWSGRNFYAGLSVPYILENYYDKNEKGTKKVNAREVRGYYASGGYVFPASDDISLQPQVMARYAGSGGYSLPLSTDINLSAIAYHRLLLGFTYRTDKSFEAIVHVQATRQINVGYAYDYILSGLNGYNGGTHEIVVGYDFARDNFKYTTPRFIKTF